MKHAQEVENMAKREEKERNSKRCFEEWVSKKTALERERRKREEQIHLEESAKEKEVSGPTI